MHADFWCARPTDSVNMVCPGKLSVYYKSKMTVALRDGHRSVLHFYGVAQFLPIDPCGSGHRGARFSALNDIPHSSAHSDGRARSDDSVSQLDLGFFPIA